MSDSCLYVFHIKSKSSILNNFILSVLTLVFRYAAVYYLIYCKCKILENFKIVIGFIRIWTHVAIIICTRVSVTH